MLLHKQNTYYASFHFSTVMTAGCPQVMLKERLKSHHIQKGRGGLVQPHTYKKQPPKALHTYLHNTVSS